MGPLTRVGSAVVGLALLALTGGRVCAGGGSFDSMNDDDQNAGPPFIGDVRDRDGQPIPDAKVTVSVQAFNSTLVVRADDQGHFTVKGFDASVDPDGVDFTCAADGYKFFARTKQKTGGDPKAPIAVTCLVEKE